MINYVELKQAMTELGYSMSAGSGWTASDDNNYRSYLYLHQNNLDTVRGKMGMAYTGILPDTFPGVGPAVELVSIAITGYTDPFAAGTTVQLMATGTYDDESTKDVTNSAIWTTDAEGVATVVKGLVTGVDEGDAEITATVGGITKSVTVTILEAVEPTEPILVSVAVTLAEEGSVIEGNSYSLVATGTYDDETTADVTEQATGWLSSNTEVLDFDDASLPEFTALGEGTANVTCEVGGITSSPLAVNVLEDIID